MPMILLQISSAHGPVECCQAVALATKRICLEAQKKSVTTEIIERTDGPKANTYRSIVLALQGQEANTLAQRWSGSVKWICPSQYRLGHKRKNWFIGVSTFKAEQTSELDPNIVFESMRSSGPGGQHVNTTESAIRATHLATGISVKVQNQRSQHANKRLAVLLIAQKLQAHQEQQESQERTQQWLQHYRVQRGNPVLTFQGLQFEPV